MCDTLASSAANQGDNTVSVAQGSTATPDTTEEWQFRLELLNEYTIYYIKFYLTFSEAFILMFSL